MGKGALVTIKNIVQEDVSMEGEQEKLRWVLYFNETEKGLVMNSTNAQLIAHFLGSEETDNWVGHKVVLYDDPTVSFGGKLVGGVRVRAPRNQPPPAASRPVFKAPTPPPPPPAEEAQSLPLEAGGDQDPF